MEDRSGPEMGAPGPCGTSAADPLEDQHRGGDSFLAAARLLRRGWSASGRKTQWQFSQTVNQPTEESPRSGSCIEPEAPSKAPMKATPKALPKAPPIGRVLLVNLSMAPEDKETRSEAKTDEGKQAAMASGGGRRPGPPARPGVTYVWASGCRNKYRLGRRFKAPILPVILEM